MDATVVELRGVGGVGRGGAEPVRAGGPWARPAVRARGVLRRVVAGAGVVLAAATTVVGLGLLADLSAAGSLPAGPTAPAVPAAVSSGR
ncbi:hypothetical protein H7X46_07455 [Pseudonocardia sp. C8]|uniref:hypothetical protein n=1 Tax=Pseudonocardia sp. C8 TaxID=2762759 RepID=UPI001642B3F2|nr:hypothetical protein [Pseudonocardia sp. C8]MBC3190897.1 hypothetical protein [Pseudonocardia sp. C8]